MIFLSSETGDQTPDKRAADSKRPVFGIIIAALILIIIAAVILLPKILNPPSNISTPSGSVSTTDELKTQMGELLTKDIGFQFLGSSDGQITDAQMAAYAVLRMENYNWETGNTREEYDVVTLKHFNKKLTDYTNNGMTEALPGSTDRIRAVGWGYEENYYALPYTLTSVGENRYIGQFYCIHAPYSFDDGWNYSAEDTASMLNDHEWEPFVQYGRTFSLIEVEFTLGQEADGSDYPIYQSVKILQTGLTFPLSSQ